MVTRKTTALPTWTALCSTSCSLTHSAIFDLHHRPAKQGWDKITCRVPCNSKLQGSYILLPPQAKFGLHMCI